MVLGEETRVQPCWLLEQGKRSWQTREIKARILRTEYQREKKAAQWENCRKLQVSPFGTFLTFNLKYLHSSVSNLTFLFQLFLRIFSPSHQYWTICFWFELVSFFKLFFMLEFHPSSWFCGFMIFISLGKFLTIISPNMYSISPAPQLLWLVF